MSTSIDTRVVEMKFENSQFKSGLKSTLASLLGLRKSLRMDGATKGLENVGKATSKLGSFNKLSSGVQNLGGKFSAMSVVAIGALASIGAKAATVGLQMAKSLTIDPVMDGLREYETNLNSIQTIMANTGLEGDKGLGKVNGALEELNEYSDKTIYNFSEMARNIGTFTAAGVDLDTSTAAIKGIANLAAVSGSNSQQASTAMYQLSQALAAGKISLMDWNSVVNAGMGGKVFQEALKDTARVHGVAVDDIIKSEGSFRESISKGWITSEILTETLSKFTGDLTDQQLKSMGYTRQQIDEIQKMGKTAQDAATKVKTVSQLIGTLQEAAGSGWAKTWQLMFGDFNEARELFTDVSKVLGGFIETSADARNKVIGDWKELGGRAALIDAIGGAFNNLLEVVKPIKEAFTDIFPAVTGKQLYDLTVGLRDLVQNFKMGEDTANNLKRTFAGVFAIFSIGWSVIKQIGKTLADLFGVATEGSGSFLEVTAAVGDFLVRLDEAIKKGDGLSNFFEGLGKILAAPIRLLQFLGEALKSAFEGLSTGGVSGMTATLGALLDRFEPLTRLGGLLAGVWERLGSAASAVADFMAPLATIFGDMFNQLGEAISSGVANMDFNQVLDAINTGLLAAIVLLVKKFFDNMGADDLGGGLVDTIKNIFGGLTETMNTMQTTLKASTLLQIGLAIGILTASVVALSMIDSAALAKALGAITVMFLQLLGAMALFEKIAMSSAFLKMPILATGLILLAAAINVLAIAVKQLSGLSWEELAKGLVGVTALIILLVGATKGLAGHAGGMISAGAGLLLLAAGIKVLASAVTDLSGLSWEEMARGLVGVGALLGALALFTKMAAVNKGGVAQGAGLILLAAGIKILASALTDIAALGWEELAKGLVGMAGGLVLMSAALMAIPPTSIASAAALVVVAAALRILAPALVAFGEMKWAEIAKAMVVLLGSLALIAAAMYVMVGALPGAAALLVVAAALRVLAPAIIAFGEMKWAEIAKAMVTLFGALLLIAAAMIAMIPALPGAAALMVVAVALNTLAPVLMAFAGMSLQEIGTGLLMLAGTFAVLGAAGLLLIPVIPALLGLGAAVTLLGVGMLAAGAGVLAFATGLTALAAAGTAGTVAIVGIVSGLAGIIPMVMRQIGLGIIAFAQTIATAGPAFVKAITMVLNSLITAINNVMPRIISTLARLLNLMLNVLVQAVPRMVQAGLQIIEGVLSGIASRIGNIVSLAIQIIVNFLNGIASQIGNVVTAATNIIVAFINGIANNLGRVIQAGVELILAFINGVTAAINNNSAALGAAGGRLAVAIVTGMANGLRAGVSTVINAAVSMASSALSAAKSALGIKSPSREFMKLGKYSAQGYAKGLDGSRSEIEATYKEMGTMMKTAHDAAKAEVKEHNSELRTLSKSRRENLKEIQKTRNELKKYRKDLRRADTAQERKTALKGIRDSERALEKLHKARRKNRIEIRETNAELSDATRELKTINTARQYYNKELAGERRNLLLLSDAYEINNKRIEKAEEVLADARKTRRDYQKSIQDSLNAPADITSETTLNQFQADMEKKLAEARRFAVLIQKLRNKGLNDTLYKELLEQGPEALPFMEELNKASKIRIRELNDLQSYLEGTAAGTGSRAADELYKAGIQSAQGIVDGLKAKEKAIAKQMERLADYMVDAIKKKLKIKSPSRVFEEIGKFTDEGLARGIEKFSGSVEKSAANVGETAIVSMRNAISKISEGVATEVDMNPTIKPVLDLSAVKKDAGQINSLIGRRLDTYDIYNNARRVDPTVRPERSTNPTLAPEGWRESIVFNQYNSSPKALSNAEIYRQSKNLISTAKGAMNNK